MTYFCFCNWTIDTWIAFTALLVSIITLVVAVIGIVVGLQKLQHYHDRRIFTRLFDLMDEIKLVQNRYYIVTEKRPWNHAYTLTELVELEAIPDDTSFYVLCNCRYNWEFLRYQYYSIIPRRFVEILKKFSLDNATSIDYDQMDKNHVLLIGDRTLHGQSKGDRCVYFKDKRTIGDIRKYYKELKTGLHEWAKENGIKDLNI